MFPSPLIDELAWRKSRYSGSQGNCVEVAPLPLGNVAVRDSKDPTGPALAFKPEEWAKFIEGVKDNEFDYARIHEGS